MPTANVRRLVEIEPLMQRMLDRLRIGRTPAVSMELLLRSALGLDYSSLLSLMLEMLHDGEHAPIAAFVLESDGSLGRARTRFIPFLAEVYQAGHVDFYAEKRSAWFLSYGIKFDELVLN